MSLKDTFARGFVWKIAGLLAIVAFGWLSGIGDARAAAAGGLFATRDLAYAACQARSAEHIYTYKECYYEAWTFGAEKGRYYARGRDSTTGIWSYPDGSGSFRWSNECPTGTTWNEATKTCKQPCDANAPPLGAGWVEGDWQNDTSMPTQVCHEGCAYNQPVGGTRKVSCVDGQCWTDTTGFTASGSSCTAGAGFGSIGAGPAPDGDGDGISNGNDGSPNNPGQTGGGAGNGPSEDGSGATCGVAGKPACPEDGSGKGSGNGNTSGGGGDCATPPSSTGDAIAANALYQNWATRCAIERLTKDGSLQVKVTNPSGTGTGNGTDMGETNGLLGTIRDKLQSIRDWMTGLENEANGLDTDQGETEEPDSVWVEPDATGLDASGFGWGNTCPAPPTYMGESLDPDGNMCMFAGIIGAFMLLGAYAQAAYIIGRA